MSNSSSSRKNWMPPVAKPPLVQATDYLKRGDFWARMGICFGASIILWLSMVGWSPMFPFRLRHAPQREMLARVEFSYEDFKITEEYRDRTRRNFLCLYANNKQELTKLGKELISDIFEIKQKSFEEVASLGIWEKFFLMPKLEEGAEPPPSPASVERFEEFKKSLEGDEKLAQLETVIKAVFLEPSEKGLLNSIEHENAAGNPNEIEVYAKGDLLDRERVLVADARLSEFLSKLEPKIFKELSVLPEGTISNPARVAERLAQWLRPRVPVTLSYDATNTTRELTKALDAIGVKKRTYEPGEPLERYRSDMSLRGIAAAAPLNYEDLDLLRAEHAALIQTEGTLPKVFRSVIFIGLIMVMFGFVTKFLQFRHPKILDNLRSFTILIGIITPTLIATSLVVLVPAWRAEVIVVMIFAMIIAIAYSIDMSVFLSSLVSLTFSVSHGYGITEFVILVVASTATAFSCKQIRSRTRLVNAGVIVAAVLFPVVIGIHYLFGQPFSTSVITEALWFSGGAGIAGLAMTAILPFLEKGFGFQTDINLLELSDPNHVLLRDLVQRAPGTYNHSINVASLSEAAAEAIGANGLLCRVASYFHDIGKIRKPEYFIENQSGINRHDDLVPTMSTLIITAHVKDGTELARLHRLPARIVDLIEQHHGTTLVEYFFKRAEKQQQAKSEELQEDVEEADYRYPGPKPQTLEAAVLMVSDAVESASRTLREPAPSRIENLVFDITRKKLEDGQFDECPITLKQLRSVQKSLIKSLNAMHHVRVHYPDKQTA